MLLPQDQALEASTAQPLLSRQQMLILGYLAEGLMNKEIAQRMGINTKTVGKHIENIFKKLDAHTRTEAVAIARRKGLLPPE